MSKITQVNAPDFIAHFAEYNSNREPLEILESGRVVGVYIPTDPMPISASSEPDATILAAIDAAPEIVLGDLLEDIDNSVPDFAVLKNEWRSEFRQSLLEHQA
jgi:hypothetical protein